MILLKEKWAATATRFNAFSQRERALLALAIVGGVVMVGATLFVEPAFLKTRSTLKLEAQATQDLRTTQVQLQSLRSQLQIDPDAEKRAEVARLKKDLVAVEGALKALEKGLVVPEQMNAVLERLLARNAQVKLVSFKSLTPVNLAASITESAKPSDTPKPPEASAGGLPGLYRHGVELRLVGRYADLMAWITQLELAEQKVLWGDVRLSVTEYPLSVLTLTVYTLNLEKSWLEI